MRDSVNRLDVTRSNAEMSKISVLGIYKIIDIAITQRNPGGDAFPCCAMMVMKNRDAAKDAFCIAKTISCVVAIVKGTDYVECAVMSSDQRITSCE